MQKLNILYICILFDFFFEVASALQRCKNCNGVPTMDECTDTIQCGDNEVYNVMDIRGGLIYTQRLYNTCNHRHIAKRDSADRDRSMMYITHHILLNCHFNPTNL